MEIAQKPSYLWEQWSIFITTYCMLWLQMWIFLLNIVFVLKTNKQNDGSDITWPLFMSILLKIPACWRTQIINRLTLIDPQVDSHECFEKENNCLLATDPFNVMTSWCVQFGTFFIWNTCAVCTFHVCLTMFCSSVWSLWNKHIGEICYIVSDSVSLKCHYLMQCLHLGHQYMCCILLCVLTQKSISVSMKLKTNSYVSWVVRQFLARFNGSVHPN